MFDAAEAQRLIQRRLRNNEELQSIALVMAWYLWSISQKPHLPTGVWAWWGIRKALAGLDLPGIYVHCSDVTRHLTGWQGGDMRSVMDNTPPPDEVVSAREQVEKFRNGLHGRDKELADAFTSGLSNQEVAQLLGVSPATITQRRARLAAEYRNQE